MGSPVGFGDEHDGRDCRQLPIEPQHADEVVSVADMEMLTDYHNAGPVEAASGEDARHIAVFRDPVERHQIARNLLALPRVAAGDCDTRRSRLGGGVSLHSRPGFPVCRTG
jgi:hypothetical protein